MNVTAHFHGQNTEVKGFDFPVNGQLTSTLQSLKTSTNAYLTECVEKASPTAATLSK